MKKITTIVTLIITTILFGNTAFASNTEVPEIKDTGEKAISIGHPIKAELNDLDLNSMDFSKAFTIEETIIDENGNEVVVGLSFEPSKESEFQTTAGSKTYDASTGTWKSSYNGGIIASMEYRFDVSKSGSQWRISNGRDLDYNALFTKFSNEKLDINRSTSTSTYPAEIRGSVYAQVFDTGWFGPIYSGTAWLKTTINSKGKLTVSWN